MPGIHVYATVENMIDRSSERELIELTDRDNIPPEAINRTKVETAIEDATAVVNGYIGIVYKLPLQGCQKLQLPGQPAEYEAPPHLTRLTCDIARYYLYPDLAPEHEVYRRREAAIKELETISKGEMMLSCPLGGSPGEVIKTDPLQAGGETFYVASPRRITDESIKGYR